MWPPLEGSERILQTGPAAVLVIVVVKDFWAPFPLLLKT